VREERIIAAALVVVALAGVGVARLDGRLWAAVVAAAVGLAAGSAKLAFDALVQRDAPDAERGRSFARFEAGFQLVWVVGALLPVVVPTPLRQGFDVLAIASAAAAVAYVLAQRRLGRVAA
jgi:cobalamin synthase